MTRKSRLRPMGSRPRPAPAARRSARLMGRTTSIRDVGALLTVFFFQAEDGIRDATVTGVQTCALPIYHPTQTGRGIMRGPFSAQVVRLERILKPRHYQ